MLLHRRFGVQESVMDWFTSYLSDRTQTFRLNGEMSSLTSLTCSVPQGSVLGSILFISYTNDVPVDIKSTIISMPMTSKRTLVFPSATSHRHALPFSTATAHGVHFVASSLTQSKRSLSGLAHAKCCRDSVTMI